jgi:uncharacterized protein YndB with AHSA1/START domain
MTEKKPEFVYVMWIQASAQRVFDALTDPEMTRDFWGRSRNVSASGDWRVGSEWRHEDYDDAGKVDVVGQVIEREPPKRLVLSWASAQMPGAVSRVTFTVEELFGSVKLTVVHEDLPEGEALARASMGWTAILSSLKTMLETGKAMPGTMRRWAS